MKKHEEVQLVVRKPLTEPTKTGSCLLDRMEATFCRRLTGEQIAAGEAVEL